MAAGDYSFTPSGDSAVNFTANTAVKSEKALAARIKWYTASGVNGQFGTLLGKGCRSMVFNGWLHASSEANLVTAQAVVEAAAAKGVPGAWTIRGASRTWANSLILEPEFSDHYINLNDGAVGVAVSFGVIQLVPD